MCRDCNLTCCLDNLSLVARWRRLKARSILLICTIQSLVSEGYFWFVWNVFDWLENDPSQRTMICAIDARNRRSVRFSFDLFVPCVFSFLFRTTLSFLFILRFQHVVGRLPLFYVEFFYDHDSIRRSPGLVRLPGDLPNAPRWARKKSNKTKWTRDLKKIK